MITNSTATGNEAALIEPDTLQESVDVASVQNESTLPHSSAQSSSQSDYPTPTFTSLTPTHISLVFPSQNWKDPLKRKHPKLNEEKPLTLFFHAGNTLYGTRFCIL
jgi:hypothetical protein